MRSTDIEDPRSTIWSVGSDDIGAYFGLYVVLYLLGSVGIVWLHVQRAGPVHEIVTGIITNMSLLGLGIAPTTAIVLTEIWGYIVILSRKLRIEVEAKEKRLREQKKQLRELEAREQRLRELEAHQQRLREEENKLREERREQAREEARKELIEEIAALGYADVAAKLRERVGAKRD